MEPTTNLTRRMGLAENLETLRSAALDSVAAASSLDELAAAESAAIGRDSEIAGARRSLGSLPAEERRDAGRLINDVFQAVQGAIDQRQGNTPDGSPRKIGTGIGRSTLLEI